MFYIEQILFVLVSFISVKEEVNGTWAFRTYVQPGTIQSKLYHRYGLVFIVIVGMLSGYAFGQTIVEKIVLTLLNGFIYWLLFDIWYAKGINEKWYYLGGEADADNMLKKFLGKNPGKTKAYICILVIIFLNIMHILFL